ncbi:MAG: carbon storage regulator [bacterium]|jgi:carbon storage regulator CsrA|nr:carbon storage regulator [Phycisphaerales bacterium]MCE2653402.1 carbon storage regulator [Planctomycetaceae bacterium]
MLVVTRREGEEVVIGDPRNPLGVVRIASIRGDRVRIAFDFPRTIQVNRSEVANQITGDAPADSAPPAADNGFTAPAAQTDTAGKLPGKPETEDRPAVIGTIRPRQIAGG